MHAVVLRASGERGWRLVRVERRLLIDLVVPLAAALGRADEELEGKGASDHAPVVVDLAD